jgi:dolichol kinase
LASDLLVECEKEMLPLTIRAPGLILSFGLFITVFFHILRRKCGSFTSLILSCFPTYLAIQPFSSGVLHTDFRDEIIPLFLKKPIFSLVGLFTVLGMLAFASVLSERVGKQVYRSLNHMAGGFLLVFFLSLGKELALLLLAAWFVAFLFAESLRALGRRGIRDGLIDFADELISKAARNPLEEKFFAPTFFTLLASFLLIGFLPFVPSLCGLLVLSLADPSAALVGIRYGRHRWPYNPQKSLEGSIAMMTVIFLLLLPFVSPWLSMLVAFSVAIFESMPLEVCDNLIVPMFAGLLLDVMSA